MGNFDNRWACTYNRLAGKRKRFTRGTERIARKPAQQTCREIEAVSKPGQASLSKRKQKNKKGETNGNIAYRRGRFHRIAYGG